MVNLNPIVRWEGATKGYAKSISRVEALQSLKMGLLVKIDEEPIT